MLKNKKYWVLMPPFLILTLVLIVYSPTEYRAYSFTPVVVFWIVYYIWSYIGKGNSRAER